MARVRAAVRNIVLSAGAASRREGAALREHGDDRRPRAELLSLLADLPACPQCRRVRTPEGDWEELGAYLARRLGVELGPTGVRSASPADPPAREREPGCLSCLAAEPLTAVLFSVVCSIHGEVTVDPRTSLTAGGFRGPGALTLAAIPCAAEDRPGRQSRPARHHTRPDPARPNPAPARTSRWPAGQGSASAVVVAHEREGFDGSSRETAAPAGAAGLRGDRSGSPVRPGGGIRRRRRGGRYRAGWWPISASRSPGSMPSRAPPSLGSGSSVSGPVRSWWSRPRAVAPTSRSWSCSTGAPAPRRTGSRRSPFRFRFTSAPRIRISHRIRRADLQSALRARGKSADVFVYPGAGREFMHEGRPSFHPDAARQAWVRTLSFLQKNLKCG